MGIIAIGLIGLGVGSTYAMFTSTIEIKDPITINATLDSEDDIIETIDLELEPNDIRVAVINLNNTSNATLNYASFYITESSDIEVGVTHNFTDTAVPTGSISNGTTKKVYIQVKNNGSSTANVTLGVLSNSGTIIKADNMTLISDTNIDTASPELLITGQDMAVQNGLIRYYNGSNNLEYSHSSSTTAWKDLSGNYDGEVKSSTWSTNSITLNGTNSHVRIGQINNLTAVTVEVYLKANSYTADSTNQIISNYNGNGLVLQLNKGIPEFSIGSGKTVSSDETMGPDLNHTITGTYDGSTVKLYVDGILKKTLSSTAGISNPTDSTPMVIGCNPNTTGCDGNYANANIYAARIYNRALTETEIKQNMNADRVSTGEASQNVNGIYTLVSNKRLSNFTTSNITVTNGTKGTFTKVNDRKYNLNITGVSESATAEISIPVNNLIDISGNKNSSAIALSRYMDVTGPTATITKNTSTSRTVTYTISFHEPAYGFTKDDITISEGTKGTFTKIDQKTYTLVVTHSTDGSKTITVKANSCNDRFGNLNASKKFNSYNRYS
ncbi:MAG: Ig-like domain-containing protein [Bacilli bacterium]|nr:MAG: Ig-like domain-containing protein [Bacilli bacterium]